MLLVLVLVWRCCSLLRECLILVQVGGAWYPTLEDELP